MSGTLDRAAYLAFLRSKFQFGRETGIAINRNVLNPMLKPHQADIVEWAARKGCAAIFASFGLGKSFMQLELCRTLISNHPGTRALIVMPLGMRMEFRADAGKLGIETSFVKRTAEIGGPGIYLTNYESVRDGKIDLSLFTIASLDEASCLRSFGSLTYQSFLTLFAGVRYRFVATATPSPNEYKELIHYAAFLGIADSGLALTKYFQRDSEKAGHLTLYKHMENEFHAWLHSWALFCSKPSDLGHDDAGYVLPELIVRTHFVRAQDTAAAPDRDGQIGMFRDAALGLKDAAREKRDSIAARVAKATEIITASPDHFIIWHDLEAERHAIKKAMPEAVEVFGALDLDERDMRVTDFAEGRSRILATKPQISGSGCNLQRYCHRAIFIGITYSFNDFVQAIHRIHRYGQSHPCEIDIVVCETEREVFRTLMRKWDKHRNLGETMADIMAAHGLAGDGIERELARTIGVTRREERGARYVMALNDTTLECDAMEPDSVDLIVTSIPFGNQYEYSETFEDFGHNTDNSRFFEQMDHLTPNLLRVLRPGRVAAIHVKDRIRFGNVTGLGMPSVDPFHADCIAHYRRHGFIFCGMITVVTDVVRENNQTYRLGWSEQCKDGSKMGVGCPEYVLLFRKLPTDTSNSYADVPVAKRKTDYTRGQWQIDAHAFWRSSGNRFLTADELAGYGPDVLAKVFTEKTLDCIYDYRAHVEVANALDERNRLPATFMCVAPGSHSEWAWHDVVRMKTLNGKQSQRNLALHVCPLQTDIVERLVERFTNKDEVVLDPFAGIGTVPYCAIKLGRQGRGVELNAEYFRDSLRYVEEAERDTSMPTLFDLDRAVAAATS